MTLVATIKVHDIPVLFGDLMLSGPDRAGTRKKILRLRPNLAIGWADVHIVARALFRELYETLPARPRIDDLTQASVRFGHENPRRR